jgi:CDP-diacylglycerol--glycerol-3-phosphate 3-phosphatidyltransferase
LFEISLISVSATLFNSKVILEGLQLTTIPRMGRASRRRPSSSTSLSKQETKHMLTALAAALKPKAPLAFPVASSQISMIKEPQVFHQTLLQGISRARERVVLASLYLGSSEHEVVISFLG